MVWRGKAQKWLCALYLEALGTAWLQGPQREAWILGKCLQVGIPAAQENGSEKWPFWVGLGREVVGGDEQAIHGEPDFPFKGMWLVC